MALLTDTDITALLKKADREVYQTKVVVRRLPPSLTSDELVERLSPLPEHDYLYLAKADTSLGQFAFSRVYINFKRFEDVITFRNRFDGFVFFGHGGRKYPAVVEFAPLQKIPHTKKIKDHKCGTIETDKDYKTFLASLEAETPSVPTAESLLEQIEARQQQAVESTPLVDFIRRKHHSAKSSSSKYASSAKFETLKSKRRKDDSAKVEKKTHSETKPATTKKDGKGKSSDYITGANERPVSAKPVKKGPIKQDERRDIKHEKGVAQSDSKKSRWPDKELTSQTKPKSGGFATHEQDWPTLGQTKSNEIGSHTRPSSAKEENTRKSVDTTSSARVKQGEGRKPRGRPSQEVYVPRAARLAQEGRSNGEERPSKPWGRGRGGQGHRQGAPNG
ncbi:regulator of nonsense transcripts 3A-like [Corticium candelabrum]|uniref:regulator of nonsense transcripts 3A-like n=1 Tax=Corticium candelabrum TaxID=121492 RepID=UPI002E25D6ED|nr:regulator of nonsense transcripts 3A-like [Corticium candelabrum]